jgi:glycosyltransferase involved in cell wall biosynthesis
VRRTSPAIAVDGVFVVGTESSGTALVYALLRRLGLRSPGAGDDPAPVTLSRFNDRLLEAIGGSADALPEIAPREAARVLDHFADEARRQFRGTATTPGVSAPSAPWVWADARNSLLASFWAKALAVNAAVVLVHRDPADVVASRPAHPSGPDEILEQWDRYNRAAVVHCSEWPALVISYEELVAGPKAAVHELGEFLEDCGVAVDGAVDDTVELAVELVEGLAGKAGMRTPASVTVDGHRQVLARVLDELNGRHVGDRQDEARKLPALMDAVASFYDENYYGTSYDKSGVPYRRDEKLWVELFAAIAGSIVDSLHPRTVLDVGCASGMLVEALRDRDVDAWGVDISEWAIEQVPPALRPFCTVGSITDELQGQYELITCSEVLEHLPPALAESSVANLCRHADAVLFSSTPSHFDEPTHLNVEPGSYWAQLFFRQGFVRDVDYDAAFLAPHAVLFRRRQVDVEGLIADYERGLSNIALQLGSHVEEAVAEHDKLAKRYNALAHEADNLREAIVGVEQRRSAETLAAFEMVRKYETSERHLAALVSIRDAEIGAMRSTKIFRYTALLRRVYGRLRRHRAAPAPTSAPAHPPDGTYDLWVEQFDTLDDATRAAIRDGVSRLGHQPKVSVIMPVFNPAPDFLRAAIDSVRGQLYPNWELCIADDCSPDGAVAEILAEYEAADPRIKVARRAENGHISATCNTALSLATGDWVTCLDHDDVLAEHALALAVTALADHPEAGIVYSDEDKLDGGGARQEPYFKPDFDPLLLLGQNFLNHVCLLRRDLVTEVGGYREGYEGSQDWDLVLRVTELLTPDRVVHVPHVLYHWRSHAGSTASSVSAKPYAVDAGRRAVIDHLARTGRSGRVTRIPKSGHNRVTWDVPDPAPLVSIIVPTRDGTLLQRCIDSVLAFTTYPNFEVVVVDNSSRTLPTLEYLRGNDDRVTVIRDERPFNYSAINNAAVRKTSGTMVCLLNDDTEIIAGDWLTELVGHVLQPGVGAAGAKLYYDDGRIQHAGVVLGMLGVAGHSHRMFDRLSPGYFGRLQVAQNLSAVTAACVVVRREAWDQVGGLDEQNLPIAFNDVDFGLRLREAGWGVVWSPYAELFHHESVSRGPDDTGPRATAFAHEFEYMQKRWGPRVLRNDPYYNPNLSLTAEDFSLAWPPRVSYR